MSNRYLRSRRKRALDVLGAAAGLLLASPVLIAAAIAIRLEGGGHFIYRQRRVGLDGEPFDLYKLRTMVTGAETMGSGLIVDRGDDRITKVGAPAAAHLARRAPEPDQRPAGRDVDRRPAADRAGPGRPLHRSTSATASTPARG